MLNTRKNMVERAPITATIVVITVSTTLRRWITGLGASLGTYPPEAKCKKIKSIKHATVKFNKKLSHPCPWPLFYRYI